MAQACMKCQKEILPGEMVMVKCLARYDKFVDGIHAVDIIEEKEIVHEGCAEQDDE
jgi:hypothetical protein